MSEWVGDFRAGHRESGRGLNPKQPPMQQTGRRCPRTSINIKSKIDDPMRTSNHTEHHQEAALGQRTKTKIHWARSENSEGIGVIKAASLHSRKNCRLTSCKLHVTSVQVKTANASQISKAIRMDRRFLSVAGAVKLRARLRARPSRSVHTPLYCEIKIDTSRWRAAGRFGGQCGGTAPCRSL